jgi:hypothetical protein
MLLRVVVGQTRFALPGLATDGKGIARGREMAVRFVGLDRLVSFLRFFTANHNLDDLGQVKLLQARREHGPRELVLFASRVSPVLAEVVAQAARTAGGPVYTGAARHFVPVREAAAPLGWDVDAVVDSPADFVLYRADGADPYRVEGEMALSSLLLRLEPQRVMGAKVPGDTLIVLARRGVASALAAYLHRAELGPPGAAGFRAFGAFCAVEGAQGGGAFRGQGREWLFLRLENVPPRMEGLLTATPGLQPAVPVGNAPHLAVAVGYRHPVHLEACRGVIPSDRFVLFPPPPEGVWIVDPVPTLAPIADIVRLELPPSSPAPAKVMRPSATAWEELAVNVELAPTGHESGRVAGVIVPPHALPWLRRLVYALPALALRRLRVALLQEGVLVLAEDELEGLPFGTLLSSPRPGVLVPLGMALRPAVSPRVLAERFGLVEGAVLVFAAPGRAPLLVSPAAIHPLESRVLLDQGLTWAPTREPVPAPPRDEIDIVNDPVGPWPMPLWGGRPR